MWLTLATLLIDATKATMDAIKEGTAESEAKALDALDALLAQSQSHVSKLREAIAANQEDAEKALHDKFDTTPQPTPHTTEESTKPGGGTP